MMLALMMGKTIFRNQHFFPFLSAERKIFLSLSLDKRYN